MRLKPGLAHLARRLDRAAIIPVAVEYNFWTERTPEALLRFAQPIAADRSRTSVHDWQGILTSGLQDTMDTLAEEAISRDPQRFHTLLGGVTGSSRMYDLMRWIRSSVTGRRFDPSHMPERP
jgi:hypothetical protein